MKAFRTVAAAAAVAALALPGAALAAPSTTITDPAGDANGLAAAGLNVATAPVSDATRDITAVTLTREQNEIVLRLALSEAPDLGGPQTFALLRAGMGACEAVFGVAWGVLDPRAESEGPIALSGRRACNEGMLGFGIGGYTATVEGSTVVARFPFAALARNQMGVSPTTTLRSLRAETRVGTYAFAVSGSWSCSDEQCEPPAIPQASMGDFFGPVVDGTATSGDFTAANRTVKKRAPRLPRG